MTFSSFGSRFYSIASHSIVRLSLLNVSPSAQKSQTRGGGEKRGEKGMKLSTSRGSRKKKEGKNTINKKRFVLKESIQVRLLVPVVPFLPSSKNPNFLFCHEKLSVFRMPLKLDHATCFFFFFLRSRAPRKIHKKFRYPLKIFIFLV